MITFFLVVCSLLSLRIRNLIQASQPVEEIFRLRGKAGYDVSDTKEKVYARLVEYLKCEQYPSMAEDEFKEGNVYDIVNAVLLSTLSDFKDKSQRDDITLHREKEIISVDEEETGGMEEFVVIDVISSTDEEEQRAYVLVVEAKRSSLAAAFRQLLLSLKDMRDTNREKGVVYGFATTGEDWQMVTYDGKFQLTEKFSVMFPRMRESKERWIKEFSVIVDLMYIALEEGGGGYVVGR